MDICCQDVTRQGSSSESLHLRNEDLRLELAKHRIHPLARDSEIPSHAFLAPGDS